MGRDEITLGITPIVDTKGLGVVEGDRVVGIYEKVAHPPQNISTSTSLSTFSGFGFSFTSRGCALLIGSKPSSSHPGCWVDP